MTPSWRAGDLATQLSLGLSGNPDTVLTGVGTLQSATASQISFLANPAYLKYLTDTQAGLVILSEAHASDCPTNALISDNPYADYARVATLVSAKPSATNKAVIHPSAHIDPDAVIGDQVSIGAGCVIGARTVIADRVHIGAHGMIDADCHIGMDTQLAARVTLYTQVSIGERCLIHSGAVIGADGFGMARDGDHWLRVPQLGGVIIGNDCDVGANTTIDRGAIEDTRIDDDVKLDNQIQIGHNVRIGAHTAIAGCVAIAGSTQIGRNCLIGGGAGITGHISLCDGVVVMARSFVTSSIRKPGQYSSVTPFQEHQRWIRNAARMKQLDKMARSIQNIERKLSDDTH